MLHMLKTNNKNSHPEPRAKRAGVRISLSRNAGAFCKVLSISVITLFFSLIATAESLAETTCSWRGTTLTVSGTGTFSGCSGGSQTYAEKVIIENGVTSIGEKAFNGARLLTSVNIPNSVTEIGYAAFSGTALTSANIPNSVTSIGEKAFLNARLTSVNIPDSVTSIGDYAFSGTFLTSINIPDSVTSIGSHAFEWASSLTSVNIPNSVTSIGEKAFFGATSLTSVNIPDSVTSNLYR